MTAVLVQPVIDRTVRGLCRRPYQGHPRGCPNFGKRAACPPEAPDLGDVFDLSAPCFCVINAFDLAAHVARMRAAHSDWSERQLVCCLYWQGSARKALEQRINTFHREHPGYLVTRCPEAMGLNVTQTLRDAAVEIEWPPKRIALQVAFAGRPLNRGALRTPSTLPLPGVS